eukprot:752264-Lingulodinium_polyedra.AAC.1
MSYFHVLMFCGFVPGNVRDLAWQSLVYSSYCFGQKELDKNSIISCWHDWKVSSHRMRTS